MFLPFAFGLNTQPITFGIEHHPFLTDLHPFFVQFGANGGFQDDAFFSQSTLCRTNFGGVALDKFFLLRNPGEPLFEVGHHLTLLSAFAGDLRGKFLGTLLKGAAVGFQLFFVGGQF